MLRKSSVRLGGLAVVALMFAGCGEARPPTYPVEGTVVYTDGTPVPGRASITFFSEVDGKEYYARSRIGPDGRFRLMTFQEGDGAPAGEHRVSIVPIPGGEETAGKPTVPPQYGTSEPSDLKVTVRPGTNTPEIRIERPKTRGAK